MYYDYKSGLSTSYGQDHKYKFIKSNWESSILEWNEASCMSACRQGGRKRYSAKSMPRSNNDKESWAHTCSQKQICHQFDSFEVINDKGNNYGKYFIEYGCDYDQ